MNVVAHAVRVTAPSFTLGREAGPRASHLAAPAPHPPPARRYGIGVLLATVTYLRGAEAEGGGFFTGYSLLPCLLVLSQAFQGIAVSWVLKYADAIVKNFAGSAVMAILVVVSSQAFGLQTTLLTWVGVAMVLVITWAYMNVVLKLKSQE